MAGTDGPVTLQDVEKDKVALAAKQDQPARSSGGGKSVTSTSDNKPVIPEGYIHRDEVTNLLSDVKSDTGRRIKDLEEQLTESQRMAQLVPGLQIQVKDALSVKDDPDGKAAMLVKWNSDLTVREADLTKREAAIKGHESEVKNANFSTLINKVATKLSVNPNALRAKAEEFGIRNEDGLTRLSVLIAEKVAATHDTLHAPDPLTGGSKGFNMATATATEKIIEGLRRKAAGQK